MPIKSFIQTRLLNIDESTTYEGILVRMQTDFELVCFNQESSEFVVFYLDTERWGGRGDYIALPKDATSRKVVTLLNYRDRDHVAQTQRILRDVAIITYLRALQDSFPHAGDCFQLELE